MVAVERGAGADAVRPRLGDGHLHRPRGHQRPQPVLAVQQRHRRPLTHDVGLRRCVEAAGAQARDVAGQHAYAVRLDATRLRLHQHARHNRRVRRRHRRALERGGDQTL